MSIRKLRNQGEAMVKIQRRRNIIPTFIPVIRKPEQRQVLQCDCNKKKAKENRPRKRSKMGQKTASRRR